MMLFNHLDLDDGSIGLSSCAFVFHHCEQYQKTSSCRIDPVVVLRLHRSSLYIEVGELFFN